MAAGEGRIEESIMAVHKKVAEEGTAAVFPEILKETAADAKNAQQRLADRKPDALTQGIQKEIERSLQQMIDELLMLRR